MTSRERVLRAIGHKSTDRAPADYGAHATVSQRLMERLSLTTHEDLLQALHVDMRRIGFDYSQPPTGPDTDGYRRSFWGTRYREPDADEGRPDNVSASTWDTRHRKQDAVVERPLNIPPFNDNSTVEDVHAHAWPDPTKLDYSGILPACEKFHGTYATFGAPWSPFFHEIGWLIGQENFLVWMLDKPDVIHAIIGHIVDYEVEATRRYLEAARGKLDIAYFGNDFGTQRGCFVSPDMWQTFIRRPLKRFFDTAHDHGCKVMKHSCGAIRDLIPFLIEDGVDILDPVQTAATGMDLPGLVRDYGSRLCFHGGVDTQTVLPFGTEADVRAVVRSYRALTREHGGYILCGSQEFIEDIPLDNILAMYDENAK
ncbi:MAG: hypothetical protein HY343_05315 [Lentisphaerae bacterium]|nr:hypothetical protein [Lentisphaerota bacterium]